MEMRRRIFGVPGIADISEDLSPLHMLTHPYFFRDPLQVAAVIAKPIIP